MRLAQAAKHTLTAHSRRAGSKVLEDAAGNGTCSLAAARRGCEVTSVDEVPARLENERRRAAAEARAVYRMTDF